MHVPVLLYRYLLPPLDPFPLLTLTLDGLLLCLFVLVLRLLSMCLLFLYFLYRLQSLFLLTLHLPDLYDLQLTLTLLDGLLHLHLSLFLSLFPFCLLRGMQMFYRHLLRLYDTFDPLLGSREIVLASASPPAGGLTVPRPWTCVTCPCCCPWSAAHAPSFFTPRLACSSSLI